MTLRRLGLVRLAIAGGGIRGSALRVEVYSDEETEARVLPQ